MLIKRLSKNRSNSLQTAYRPCTVDELVGNNVSKTTLKNYLDGNKLPHTLLFSGPAGTGKTTAARIVAMGLNCESVATSTSQPCLKCASCLSILSGSSMDVTEHNVGKDGGKSDMSDIVDTLPFAPFNSRNKVIIFDEAHMLTAAAKDLLLKDAEDGYSYIYFIFCTNRPEELQSKKDGGNAFLSRCTKVTFDALPQDQLHSILTNVLEFEGTVYNEEVLNLIVSETKGIPRDALVALDSVINEGSWTIDSANTILGGIAAENTPAIIDLSKSLMAGKWLESCKHYEVLAKTVSIEGIRIAICGYFVGCLKRSTKFAEARKFSMMLDIIIDPIYTTGKPGEQIFYHKMFKIVNLVKG
jgi:DNA polymerase III subunit gamma/tau